MNFTWMEWNDVRVCCSNYKEISCYLRDQFIVTWKWLDKHKKHLRVHTRTLTHSLTDSHTVLPHKSHYSIERYGQIHIELYQFLFCIFTFICKGFLDFVSFIDCPIFFRSFALWLKDPNKYVYINCNQSDQLIAATISFVHQSIGKDYSKYFTDVPFLCPSYILSVKLLSMNGIGWFASSMTKSVENIDKKERFHSSIWMSNFLVFSIIIHVTVV